MVQNPVKANPYPLFDAEAVAANRRAELTPVQRAALQKSARDLARVPLALPPLYVALYALSAALLAVAAGQPLAGWLQGNPTFLAIGAAGIIVLSGLSAHQWLRHVRPLRRALAQPRVTHVTGAVTEQAGAFVLDIRQGERQGERLSLDGWPDLPPGIYRFYYLSGADRLLSVEPLSGLLDGERSNGRVH